MTDTKRIREQWEQTGEPGVQTLEARGLVAEEHLLALCDVAEAASAFVEMERANPLDWNYGPTADAMDRLRDALRGEGK